MTDKELRKKLRKKAKKLAKWGKRHGVPYASMFYMLDGFVTMSGYVIDADTWHIAGETNEGARVAHCGFLGHEDE